MSQSSQDTMHTIGQFSVISSPTCVFWEVKANERIQKNSTQAGEECAIWHTESNGIETGTLEVWGGNASHYVTMLSAIYLLKGNYEVIIMFIYFIFHSIIWSILCFWWTSALRLFVTKHFQFLGFLKLGRQSKYYSNAYNFLQVCYEIIRRLFWDNSKDPSQTVCLSIDQTFRSIFMG